MVKSSYMDAHLPHVLYKLDKTTQALSFMQNYGRMDLQLSLEHGLRGTLCFLTPHFTM